MNFTSDFSAETISRTPPTQIVQCSMRMPCISHISSFCVRNGYWALSQSKPFGVRIFWMSRNSKKSSKWSCHLRISVPMKARTACEPLLSILPKRRRSISSSTDVRKNVEYKSFWRNAIEVGVLFHAPFWVITRPSGRTFCVGVMST